MGSTRFYGKVLKKVLDKPLLWILIKRLELVKTPHKIIIATGPLEKNKQIVDFSKKIRIPCFTGSEEDVLDRYYQTAKEYNGEIIVRITSDCPLMDPDLIDRGLDIFLNENYDYISNNKPETYPDGYDIEIFRFTALETAWKETKLPSDREHVTPYIWKNKDRFTQTVYKCERDLSKYRITIDEPEDYEFLKRIFENFHDKWLEVRLNDVIDFLTKNPDIFNINAHLIRNEGYLKSLEMDKKYLND